MGNSIDERYETLKPMLAAAGQEHLFAFWQDLSSDQRRALLDDVDRIDLKQLSGLVELVVAGKRQALSAEQIEPAPVIRRDSVSHEAIECGRSLPAQGKVAALTVAGGQGTRLGFAGPKGALPISPVKKKPLFQLFAESILATERRLDAELRWYIMTSPANDGPTKAFFENHRHFGLSAERVRFFTQGVVPSFDTQGRILLDERYRVALAPDGHGGTLLALSRSGALMEMARHGIEHISYFQVDNPLVYCLDPAFLGLHATRNSDMSSKTLPKTEDLEHVGNFVLADGKLQVIEYSDLPDRLARARNQDGSRKFDAANTAIHILSRSFVERLTADVRHFGLPWHLARKKMPHIDLESGDRVSPETANAVKLEAFIFDALPLANRPILMDTSRAEEFSPVKNPTGVDSVETARRDMSLRAARWLEAAGLEVRRDETGEPTSRYEISPLFALEAEDLRASGKMSGPSTAGSDEGRDVYLGE